MIMSGIGGQYFGTYDFHTYSDYVGFSMREQTSPSPLQFVASFPLYHNKRQDTDSVVDKGIT